MFADIATGHTWGADVLFLIAAIAFGIATIVSAIRRRRVTPSDPAYADRIDVAIYSATFAYAGLTLQAIALLIL